MQNRGGHYEFVYDSSASNTGRKLPRRYNGFDAQLKWLHNGGSVTELRGEYWWGTQTASAQTSETPSTVFTTDYYYTRKFDGAFFYVLHSFDKHNQVGVKFDWYDPNTLVKEKEIGNGNGTTAADIKYNTLGIGYIHYFNEALKVVVWYEFVKNESTLLTGYTSDLKDNIVTLRLQFRF